MGSICVHIQAPLKWLTGKRGRGVLSYSHNNNVNIIIIFNMTFNFFRDYYLLLIIIIIIVLYYYSGTKKWVHEITTQDVNVSDRDQRQKNALP